jgi:hypothetical protein
MFWIRKKTDFDARLYSQALKEAESLKISSFDTVDRLTLHRIIVRRGLFPHMKTPSKDALIETVSSREFKL